METQSVKWAASGACHLPMLTTLGSMSFGFLHPFYDGFAQKPAQRITANNEEMSTSHRNQKTNPQKSNLHE